MPKNLQQFLKLNLQIDAKTIVVILTLLCGGGGAGYSINKVSEIQTEMSNLKLELSKIQETQKENCDRLPRIETSLEFIQKLLSELRTKK